MPTTQEAIDSGEGATRTSLRIILSEEILQALKRRAEERGVAVTTFANYLLMRAVMED